MTQADITEAIEAWRRSSRDKSTQPVQGETFGLFRIVGESPKRNTRGSLAWQCECVAASHPTTIEHAVLAYGATPTQCAVCVEAEAAVRAAMKADERRLEAEFRNMQQLARKEAQVAQQLQEGASNV